MVEDAPLNVSPVEVAKFIEAEKVNVLVPSVIALVLMLLLAIPGVVIL
jgi:hypothetical protein